MAAKSKAYGEHRGRAAERQAEQSRVGREIGKPRPCKNPKRRAAARLDFRRFCLSYFPWLFSLPFCPDHLKVIAKIEASVLEGGLFAVAMPRGAGKTTLCECACLWALLYGHRRFVVLIGADQGAAARMLESIKVELETNELLFDDFNEVCHPIVELERIANRCKGQLCEGKPTHILWTADAVALPVVSRSKASGGVVMIGGLTASIRGLKFKRADGKAVRPDLVVIDDPQTDDSARSPSQCVYRERIVAGAILGMAGPGQKIAGIMPCTVVAQDDMADRLLDQSKHPEWRGERMRLMYSLPTNEKLWEEYAIIRKESLRREDGGRSATEFYRNNQEAMDDGAAVAWPERFEPDEVSAVQHAMNLKIDRPEVWAAEYQNQPLSTVQAASMQLTPDQIAARVNRHARGLAPGWAARLTAGIDVQKDLLFWCVCGWSDDFTGAVIDYGAFPGQPLNYFRADSARPTLSQATGVGSFEGSLFAGLTGLADQILGREWPLDGGGGLRIERCLVDANWGDSTKAVYAWVRQSPHAALLAPSHGKGIGASGVPMDLWKREPGERRAPPEMPGWVMPLPKPGRVRHVTFDANAWKSFLQARLGQPLGERGALTLFGERPAEHRMFAEHLTAEHPVRTSGNNRELDEWKIRPGRPDNHLLDAAILALVAASMQGCQLGGMGAARPAERKRVSWAEMQRKAREGRR